MALVFLDSFDHYATADLPAKYASSTNCTIVSTAGRRSSGGLRIGSGSGLVQTFSFPGVSGNTAIVGLAVKVTAYGTTVRNLLSLRTTTGSQLSLTLSATGLLEVHRGDSTGALLGSTTATLAVGTVYFVELKAVVHPSIGTVDVHVNGASVLSLTGQNTANTAVAGWSILTLGVDGINGATYDHDDLYLLDGSGSAPLNDFLGDSRVDARFPSGAGANTTWTPSAGANYTCVDDATPNGDTDYVTAASAGLKDTYATQDAPVVGGQIFGVQVVWNVKKLDNGSCSVNPVIRHAGTDYTGPAQNPTTAYLFETQPYGTNPGTSAAWVEADFNNAEFGLTRSV